MNQTVELQRLNAGIDPKTGKERYTFAIPAAVENHFHPNTELAQIRRDPDDPSTLQGILPNGQIIINFCFGDDPDILFISYFLRCSQEPQILQEDTVNLKAMDIFGFEKVEIKIAPDASFMTLNDQKPVIVDYNPKLYPQLN